MVILHRTGGKSRPPAGSGLLSVGKNAPSRLAVLDCSALRSPAGPTRASYCCVLSLYYFWISRVAPEGEGVRSLDNLLPASVPLRSLSAGLAKPISGDGVIPSGALLRRARLGIKPRSRQPRRSVALRDLQPRRPVALRDLPI